MTNPFDFTGKSVFVAGGSSGINLGIAEAFAAAGASLAIASRSQQRVDGACAQLARHGGAGHAPTSCSQSSSSATCHNAFEPNVVRISFGCSKSSLT